MTRRRATSQDDTRQTENMLPEVTQDAPTAEAVRDKNGWELDQWGLPLCGPARHARLWELGLPDPNEDPDAWEAAPAPADPGVNDDGAITTGNAITKDEETVNG